MELITVLIAVVGLSYSVLEEYAKKRTELKKANDLIRQKEYDEFSRKVAEEEALEKERNKPFKTALECFQEQYISYSRIKTYDFCPYRFKLSYLDRNKGSSGFINYEKGIIFHKAVERYLKTLIIPTISKLDYREIVKEAYRLGYLEDAQKHWSQKQKDFIKRRREIFRNNAKYFCDTFPENVEIVSVEQELSFDVNGIKFYGIVDLVLKYPDGHFEIVDYKTGKMLPIKEQLEIYSIPFIQQNHFSNISFRIICVDRESHYLWSSNKEEMVNSAKKIKTIVNTIVKDITFKPNLSLKCKSCSLKEYCKFAKNNKSARMKSQRISFLTKLNCKYEFKTRMPSHLPQKSTPEIIPKSIKYCGSIASKVFHRSDCVSVESLLATNIIYFASKKQAEEQGRIHCKHCNS